MGNAKRPRPERQTTVHAVAGCFSCGDTREKPRWTARNAMAVAASHARHYGHATWCTQDLEVLYGKPGTEFDIPLPGMRPPALADNPQPVGAPLVS